MPQQDSRSEQFDELRQRAEKIIRQQPEFNPDSQIDILDLIHELRIHQAELEIQNEELKRAQQELAELYGEYQNLYEFAPCGYLTIDKKGIITHANLSVSRILCTEKEYLFRQGFSHYIDPLYEERFFSARVKCAQSGMKESIEIPIKRKNESPLWIRLEIEADRDQKGEVEQWRMIIMDISKEKEIFEALEKSEEKFRKIMESVPDPLYVCSSGFTIEYVNEAMQKRVGRNAIGEKCHDVVHGLHEPCEWCPLETVTHGNVLEQKVLSPLDNRSFQITHSPILKNDGTVSILTIYRDITDYLKAIKEKEKIQEQLRQHQKMESIGRLAGGIAHDFNNILASIIGFTELSLEEAKCGTELEGNLQEVYRSSKRAKDLVAQILAFARQTNEEIDPFQIKEIISECIGFLRSSLPSTIKIIHELKSDSFVLGNATQFHQVMMNLATNAMYAMEERGGTLKITLSDIELDNEDIEKNHLEKSGRFIIITVSDTGTGIAPDVLQSVFEPYYTTKGLGKGTGLGLAIVHGTIKKYGGNITVESESGKGTLFKILLPAIDKPDKKRSILPASVTQGTEKILFIDDEISIAKMGKRILENIGYEVTSCTSSIDALKLFHSRPNDFDLVISDMTMPDLTGDQLAVEMIKIKPEIQIILCTGYSDKISEKAALAIGVKSLIFKPVTIASLSKTVRDILDKANDKT